LTGATGRSDPGGRADAPAWGDAAITAALRTVALFGFLVGAYSLSVAVLRPQYLAARVPGLPGGRCDSVGALSLVVSMVAMIAAGARGRSHWLVDGFRAIQAARFWPAGRRALMWCLFVVPGYATLGWFYILANSISHRRSLSQPLTHLADFPTERAFAAGCFSLAVVGVLVQAGFVSRISAGSLRSDRA
jgi:hypothetical protein